MSEQQVQEIQMSIDQAKGFIEAGKAVQRLQKHPDFRDIVSVGYLRNEAIRLVHLKSDPSMQTPERQRAIDNDIMAIGTFATYMNTILQHARMSADAMEQDEQAMEELRAEDADSGLGGTPSSVSAEGVH